MNQESRRMSFAKIASMVLAIALAVLPMQAFGATVSKSFTDHSTASSALVVFGEETFTFAVSGTFVGTVKLQKSKNGLDWQDTGVSATGAYSAIHQSQNARGKREYYRVYASTHTSGTIVTSLADVNDTVSVHKSLKGVDVVAFKDDGLSVTGTLDVSGTATLVGVNTTGNVAVTAALVRVASNSASGLPFDIKGAYSSTEISLLSGASGDVVWNSTLYTVCGGTGTVASLGAYVLPRSTATTATLIPCYGTN